MTQTQAQETEADFEDNVWHSPATWEDLLSGLRGEVYTAKCGKVCQGVRGVMRRRSDLPPMKKCIVCADLWGVPL